MPPARFHCNANRDRLANKSPGRGGGRPMQAWERGDAAMMRYAQQAATGLAFRRQGSENPEIHGTFEFRVGQDVKSGQPAITRGLDRLDALCRGRTSAVADVRIFNFPISGEPEIGWQPVKGLDRLSGDWRAIKRAPIALDRLPPPARLHPSDQGSRQGRAPLRLLHHFCTHSRFKRGTNTVTALPGARAGRPRGWLQQAVWTRPDAHLHVARMRARKRCLWLSSILATRRHAWSTMSGSV